MAEARRQEDWALASSIMALTANCHRDPKRSPRPYRPSDFDPFAERTKPPLPVSARELGAWIMPHKEPQP